MTPARAAIGSFVFFFVAPGIVAGAIPAAITGWRLPEPLPLGGILFGLGVLLVVPGLWVLVDSFVRFARSLGTPAPIAPTERLVVEGWYQHVRNPMYVAVVSLILGQALLFGSWPAVIWGVVVFVAVHLFVVAYEEPTLGAQFGADYARYRAHVGRWLPRLTPWRANEN